MSEYPPPLPDTKDWTWVLAEPCPDCGFAAAAHGPDFAAEVEAAAEFWRARLLAPDVRERPGDGVWSPLEYGCHVRDVLTVFDRRYGLMLAEDGARFADWNQDRTALDGDYPGQDPAAVSDQIVANGAAVARRLRGMADGDWTRAGIRSNGSAFTVDSLTRYLLHDLLHHEWDVRR